MTDCRFAWFEQLMQKNVSSVCGSGGPAAGADARNAFYFPESQALTIRYHSSEISMPLARLINGESE